MKHPHTHRYCEERLRIANARLSLVTTPSTRQSIINTELKLFQGELQGAFESSLRMVLDTLNEIQVSLMREELILLVEGMLALREIKPTMESETISTGGPAFKCSKPDHHGSAIICPICKYVNHKTIDFFCFNCGGELEA